MINHHPDTQILTDFAAGSLPFGQSLCVSVHLESCTACRNQLRALNHIGGELFEQLKPAPVDGGMLDQIMARINTKEAPSPAPEAAMTRLPHPVPGIPRALAKLLPNGLLAVDWKRTTPSLQTAALSLDDGATHVSLIRMQPGGGIGEHFHGGTELTVVLKGGFSDHRGVYERGDFVALSRHDTHQPKAHQHEECICLTAQDAPIRFTGVKGLLLNRFIQINPS